MTSSLGSSPEHSGGVPVSAHPSAEADSYVPPRTRQRVYKAPPALAVPDIDEDAAERKRVLNVLAQRRYRERKRQNKKKNLKATVSGGEVSTGNSKGSPAPSSGTSASSRLGTEAGSHGSSPQDAGDFVSGIIGTLGSAVPGILGSPSSQGIQGSSPGEWTASIPFIEPDLEATDFSNDIQMPSFILEGSSRNTTDTTAQDLNLDQAIQTGSLEAGIDPVSLYLTSSSLSSSSSVSTTSATSFPDSYLLPMNELTILRAVMRISERLNCTSAIWSLDATSPFCTGSATPADQLPESWRPTATQLLVPHHPIIDFLPWPGVRERLIDVMSLPDGLRPAAAAGPTALVNFAYDVEDAAEGMRIWGGDVYDVSAWEVGQVLFERWWFLFDREIIENSNRWRALRGAAKLRMGRVEGEV